jgi:tRNA-dihydrouridine synthase
LSTNLKIPFSIKTRTWLNKDDKKNQMEFLIKASKYCHLITVHSRTLKELYTWQWDREFIYELKRQIKKSWNNCKIIWNWAIKTYEDISNKINNLDWIMIAQATIWNPRIFTDHIPTQQEKFDTIIEHLELMAKYEIFTSNLSLKNIKWKKIHPLLKQIESIDIESNYEKVYYTPLLFRKYLHQYLKWIIWWKKLKELCNKTTDFKENISHIRWFFKKNN